MSVNVYNRFRGHTRADLALSVGGMSCTRTGDEVICIVQSCSSAVKSAGRYGAWALSSICILRSKCDLISLCEYLEGVRDMYV